MPLSSAFMLQGSGVVSIVGAGGKTTLMFRLAKELSEAGQRVLTTTTTKVMMPRPDQAPWVIIDADPQEALKKASSAQGCHIFAAAQPYGEEGKLSGFPPDTIDEFWESGVFGWILVEADGAAQRSLKAPAPHEPVVPQTSRWVIAVAGMDAVGTPLDQDTVFRVDLFSTITGLAQGRIITEESVAISIAHRRGVMRGSPQEASRLLFLNKAENPPRIAAARRIVRLLSAVKENRPRRVVIGSAIGDPPVAEYHEL